MITFFVAPGAVTDDEVWNTLLRSHEAEAKRQGAEFGNYGWGTTDNGICSKTTRGRLSSEINPETMRVEHYWRIA
jgi:hypothetical protein